MDLLNYRVIFSPLNWLIVFLMLVMAMFVIESLAQLKHSTHPCNCNSES